jgi:glycosyltransferase involved in cell wall biosynthesis
MQNSLETSPPDLSFVIPVLDEQPSLAALTQGIQEVLRQRQLRGEIIFIDDGSRDDSWREIVRLAAEFPEVSGIRFRRNFGKAAALAAGFNAAIGKNVFTMDADLQDDPEEVPRFLEKLDQGLDVVSGWKQVRHDPWHKRWPSLVFNWLVGVMTGVKIHDHNCGFKVYRREVVAELNLYGEMHRFVPVLAAARGWRVGEIAVRHHARKFGQSKYGMKRLVKGFLDLATVYFLTGYARRPLHFLGTVGLMAFVFGFVTLGILTAGWVVTRALPGCDPLDLHERAIFYYAITSILLGTQLLVAGLLAEMFAAASSRTTIPYSISEGTKPGIGSV